MCWANTQAVFLVLSRRRTDWVLLVTIFGRNNTQSFGSVTRVAGRNAWWAEALRPGERPAAAEARAGREGVSGGVSAACQGRVRAGRDGWPHEQLSDRSV